MSPGLGQLITSGGVRDAIHIAVAPVEAHENLKPGAHVGIRSDGKATMDMKAIGIVDPFLTKPVKRGEVFWLCLYPNTVTSLRHEWEHPAFHDKDKAEAAAWLTDFGAELDLSLEELLDAADCYLRSGGSYCLAFDLPDRVWHDRRDFWVHYQILVGKVINPDKWEDTFFSCAC
jgi:hypothetical protein